jgi:hypothetical protein
VLLPLASAACHCAAEGCHRTFGSETGFNDHRSDGVCHDPARLRTRRYELLTRGGWTRWVKVLTEQDRERMRDAGWSGA